MKPFSAKLKSGQTFVGLGLSESDLHRLRLGDPVVIDLASIGVGLWAKDAEGKRTFLQPHASNLLVMAGDSPEDIGELLNVDLAALLNS